MFNWLFKKEDKNDFEQHKGAVQTALNNVKQDMGNISKWIKHLDQQDSEVKTDVEDIKEELSSIREELNEIKEMISENNNQNMVKIEPQFKQRQTAAVKQTAVYAEQTAVQTTVQAGFLTKLSISERAIVGILLQSELKLSYEDLAAVTGKDTATVRGQVNSIRQKCEGAIEEQVEKNGKKRLFIPENIKDLLLKKAKIRSKKTKNE
jgi:DNA-directed RNA polymerase specialized sigma24 family protein